MSAELNLNNSAFDDIINDPGAVEIPASAIKEGIESVDQTNSGQSVDTPDPTLDSFDNLDPNSQLNNLEDQEEKVDGEKEGKEDESEAKEKDGDKEEDKDGEKKETGDKEEAKEKEAAPKIEGKTLKMFKDGERFEVPMDATIKVKVNGKNEIVPISELRDTYSGQQAWDKKMPELAEKERVVDNKEQELNRVQSTLRSNLEGTRSELLDALDQKGDPLASINKIVDMLGVDSYDFNKALFESMIGELSGLQQMDEVEQEAYWLKKQNTHINDKHANLADQQKQTKAQEDRYAEIDRMRESHGVSENDFVSAFEELSQDGKEVTPEQAVKYAQNLPLLKIAEEALLPYEDQLSDDEMDSTMARIAQAMKADRSLTGDDVAAYLSELYQVNDLVDSVNRKAERMEAGKDETKRSPNSISQQNLYSNPTHESFGDLVE